MNLIRAHETAANGERKSFPAREHLILRKNAALWALGGEKQELRRLYTLRTAQLLLFLQSTSACGVEFWEPGVGVEWILPAISAALIDHSDPVEEGS